MLLSNIALFITIVEKGSLTAAGREMGLSATTVSERLAALEAHYNVVLLNRTTRAISLTDEGRALVEGAKIVLSEVEDLDSRIRLGADTLSGPIRMSAPIDMGRNIVAKLISKFLEDHPAISIEFILSDSYVDIVGQGIDIALRYGHISDSTLRIKNIGQTRRIVCASPAYLEKYGIPTKPVDLKSHNCLVMKFGTLVDNVWRFGPNTSPQTITVKGDRIANDGALIREWCLEGCGIVFKSEVDVGIDIQKGRLVELLSEYVTPTAPIQMLFPPSRAQPRRVKALADRLAEGLAGYLDKN